MSLHDGGGTRYPFAGPKIERETGDAGATGLMNDGARMVEPALGRFLAADPAGQFHSPYVYAGNNPVVMVDPDGESIVAAAFIGAWVAGTITIGQGIVTGKDVTERELLMNMAMGAVTGMTMGGGLDLSR